MDIMQKKKKQTKNIHIYKFYFKRFYILTFYMCVSLRRVYLNNIIIIINLKKKIK